MAADGMDVVAILERHARFLGGKPALIDEDAVTYAQLWAEATEIAKRLADLGLVAGDRVAVAHVPSSDYAILLVGVMRAGLVAAPVNTWLTPSEITDYLDRLSPRAVISDETSSGKVDRSGVAHLVAARGAGGWTIRPTGQRVVAGPARSDIDPDAAFIIGTGGTTGVPKGALFTKRAAFMWAVCGSYAQQLRQSDVELFGSPFFHSTILTGVFTPLVAGCTVRVIRHYDADSVIEAVLRDGGTRLAGAPTMLHRVLGEALQAPEQWQQVRVVQFGSTKSPPGFVDLVHEALPHAELITGYGTTEYGPVTRIFTADLLGDTPRGVGRPVPSADVRILNRATQQLTVDADVEGEIVATCPWQMSRYIGTSESAILPSDHIVSGDIGRFDADGYLHFVGRYKEIIITGGENVFPVEVEGVLAGHPSIADVVVYGVDDPVWGERVESAVVTRPGTDISIDELRDFCRPHLAGFKIPKTLVKLEKLPLTSNLKVDRRALSGTKH